MTDLQLAILLRHIEARIEKASENCGDPQATTEFDAIATDLNEQCNLLEREQPTA